VHDRANVSEGKKEAPVRVGVGRRPVAALHFIPLEIDDDHVRRRKLRKVDAARLDGEDALGAVEAADVAKRHVDEFMLRQTLVRVAAFFAEVRIVHVVPRPGTR
jgi:hypothetical protein